MNDVMRILEGMGRGEAQPADALLPLVYEELRKLAAAKMASENPGQTLQPTALVHEAWLRLTGAEGRKWNDRTHFFAAAAEAMRRIVVDNARRKRAQRRGGGHRRTEVPEIAAPSTPNDDQLLAVNEALNKPAGFDRQKAELVKLRYFVGMTLDEAAEVLGISKATANAIGLTPVPGWWRKSATRNPADRQNPMPIAGTRQSAAHEEIGWASTSRR